MGTPFTERYELFKTVKSLHNQGKVKLSADEQTQIERQTMDLIRKSVLSKSAASVPEGFEDLLRKIEGSEDAEDAYSLIKDFMKSEGMLEGDGDGDADDSPLGDGPSKGKGPVGDGDADDSPMGDGPPKGKGPKGPMGDGDGDSDDLPKGHSPSKGKGPMGDGDADADDSPMGGGPPKGKGPMGGGPPKGKGPMGEGPGDIGKKDMDLDIMRAKVLKDAQTVGKPNKSIKDLQDQDSKGGKSVSETEMGIEESDGAAYVPGSEDHDLSASTRASRVRVAITRSKTLVAQHVDYGPIFHAVPGSNIRNNPAALRRLANKVYGLCVSEGYAKAAAMCNAKLLPNVTAGVDDDVELDSVEDVSPASEGIVGDGERDTREDYDDDGESTVLTGGEVDTQEKPETVTARRRAVSLHARLARQLSKEGKDILDDAENVNRPSEAKPAKPSMSVTDDADTNAQEQHSDSSKSSLDGYDNDVRNAQKHMTQIYAKRMEKRVAEEKEAFVRRFTRAMRIVSTRMRLNHTEHPLKVAAVDVLAADGGEIEFSDSDVYGGMDVTAAVELTELIMQEGQDDFIKTLLEKSADLMQKDDTYLADVEADLFDQAPIAVKVDASAKKSPTQRKANNLRKEAMGGSNFDVNEGHPLPRPQQITRNADVSTALGGDTRIGRRLGRYQGTR